MSFSFLDPYFLFLLPIYFFVRKKATSVPIFFPNVKFILYDNLAPRSKRKFNFKFMPFFSWCFLSLALANPVLVNKQVNIEQKNSSISLLLDVSGSMSALDFSTRNKIKTRLDVAKKSINNFIKKRQEDSLSLIVFGDYAYLDTPFSIDYQSLLANLQDITVGIAGDRTAIGDAITLAISKIKDKKDNSKAIILLTDGENTSGTIEPIKAARLAKNYNIPIYTIGVGSNGEAPFISENGKVFYARVALDIKTLTSVAQITGGKFYRAQNTGELSQIYKELNKLLKVKNKANIIYNYAYLYRYFVLLAIIFLLLSFYRKAV